MARIPPSVSFAFAAGGLALACVGLSARSDALAISSVRRTPVVSTVERCAPAVVNITTSSREGGVSSRGAGSGVIVHPDGFVVTNSHVVRGATQVLVELSRAVKEGRPTFEARVLEDDPAHDLALLQIAKSRTFPYVSICSTCAVLVGETAVAIGNPYGLGDTVTVGIVSALGRSASLPTGYTIKNLIQTDASINLGNSGGALLNLDGELMGINSSIHPSAKGIAFSVPGDAVLELLDRNLGARARPARPSCPVTADDEGAPVATLPPALPYEEPSTPPPAYVADSPAPAPSTSVARPKRSPIGLMLRTSADGVLVSSVTSQSSADIAGILGGDLILDVDGKPYTSAPELADLFQKAAPGRTFFLDLRRGGRATNAIIVVPFK